MGAATLWGISGVVAKALFNRQVEPQTLVEIRLTGAFLLLLIILVLRGERLRVPRPQLVGLIFLGLAMTSAQFTYYFTIRLTGVSTALFLQYTAPIFVALYARLVDRERLSPLKVGAIMLAIVGSYLLVTGGGGIRVSPLGLVGGILSAVTFGAYAIIGRGRVHQVNSDHPRLCARLRCGRLECDCPSVEGVRRKLRSRGVGIIRVHRGLCHDPAVRPVPVRAADDLAQHGQHHRDPGTGRRQCGRLPHPGRNPWRFADRGRAGHRGSRRLDPGRRPHPGSATSPSSSCA